jgi:ElaB/YqjD/DUF883 family membrane-anchored ribosome-binding protein
MPRDCVLKGMPVGCERKGSSIVCDRPADFECDDKGYLQIDALADKLDTATKGTEMKSKLELERVLHDSKQNLQRVLHDSKQNFKEILTQLANITTKMKGATVNDRAAKIEVQTLASSINSLLGQEPYKSVAIGGRIKNKKTKIRKNKKGKTRRRMR